MNNKILLILLTFISSWSFSQTIYSFGPVASYPNPGWVSNSNTGPANRVLNYQNNAGFVSSNDFPAGNRYVNGQITTYTSPIINTTCSNASTVTLTIQIGVDLESRYDWGYFQYSLNGGVTWNNPVALSAQNNTSGVNLGAYTPLINWVNNNSNRNGWTNTINSTLNYTIPSSANSRFRFIFASDGSVNSYSVGFTTYDYYFDIYQFDINCNVSLPIELLSFNGENLGSYNNLKWTTASEINNDYFTIERSEDGYDWDTIGKVDGSGNSTELKSYSLIDDSYNSVLNYYRLKQTDFNGNYKYSDIITIDNRVIDPKITKITNLLGQEVNEYYSGIVIIYYDNGKNIKKIQ